MQPLPLWKPDTPIKFLTDITPQLASWDRSTHPSQIRLQAYLQQIMDELLPLPVEDGPLFLHLDVDVQKPEYLIKHHDLENYLTPLFGKKRLDPARFVLVTARKYVGGGSQLILGTATPFVDNQLPEGWTCFAFAARGSVQSRQWKESLRNALAATNPISLNTSAVEIQISWTCSPNRNWVSLWKPTGDCLGPILGEQNPLRPFAPDDDHIVAIKFHRTHDDTIGNDVNISLWWRFTPLLSSRGNKSSIE